MSPSTPPRGKASAAAGARLMEDVERALARVDPSASHAGASPSERRVATALRGARGLARADLERRLVSRAACDALAELQRRLDAAKAGTQGPRCWEKISSRRFGAVFTICPATARCAGPA